MKILFFLLFTWTNFALASDSICQDLLIESGQNKEKGTSYCCSGKVPNILTKLPSGDLMYSDPAWYGPTFKRVGGKGSNIYMESKPDSSTPNLIVFIGANMQFIQNDESSYATCKKLK